MHNLTRSLSLLAALATPLTAQQFIETFSYPNGTLIRTWGEYGETPSGFGLASGIAFDAEGHVWVTDGAFNRILRFTLP